MWRLLAARIPRYDIETNKFQSKQPPSVPADKVTQDERKSGIGCAR